MKQTEKIKQVMASCKTCQELKEKEELVNNDRLPIEIFHEAGKNFWNHFKTHFEDDNQ